VCKLGISRSGVRAVAYLIRKVGREALEFADLAGVEGADEILDPGVLCTRQALEDGMLKLKCKLRPRFGSP
jgi:hypothetical protein